MPDLTPDDVLRDLTEWVRVDPPPVMGKPSDSDLARQLLDAREALRAAMPFHEGYLEGCEDHGDGTADDYPRAAAIIDAIRACLPECSPVLPEHSPVLPEHQEPDDA